MKNKKIINIGMFILVLTMSMFIVSSAPPFEIPSVSSYVIEFPQLDKAYYNTSFEFYSHIYFNNGLQLIEVVDKENLLCSLDGHLPNGNISFHVNLINIYDSVWYAHVPETYFNFVGDAYYTLHCTDLNNVVGIVSIPFVVLEDAPFIDDKKFNFDLTEPTNIILLVLIVLVIGVLIYFKLNMFAGLILGLIGFMLIISKYNFVLSLFITICGVILAIMDN